MSWSIFKNVIVKYVCVIKDKDSESKNASCFILANFL